MKIKQILVPIDFSEASLQALEYAVQVARPFKAKLVVLSVIEPIHYASPTHLYAPAVNLSMVLQEQQRMARGELERLERRLKQRGIRCEAMLRTGPASITVVKTGKKLGVDLIVMATHGRTGVSRLLMGSVAQQVVHTAPCPVLTVRIPVPTRPRRRTPRKKKGR